MFKFKTDDIFMTDRGDILQIIHINEKLVRLSVYNKAITVQWLYKSGDMGMTSVVDKEITIPLAAIEDWNCKYLGNKIGVAQVLYGSNLSAIKAKT